MFSDIEVLNALMSADFESIIMGNHPPKKKKFSAASSGLYGEYFNTDVDCPLISAIKNGKDETVIQKLIEEESNSNNDLDFELSLCVALQTNSKNIVEILLNAGSSLSGCGHHDSVIHCYLENPCSGLREDMLDLLQERGADLKMLDRKSPILCFALSHGANVSDIKLLLRRGVDLDSCKSHKSLMMCLTSNIGRPVKASVVELLRDFGAQVNVVDPICGFAPLQCALFSCKLEISAIKLLFDLQSAYPEITTENLLHCAVQNPYCNLQTVKFLVSQGIAVNTTDPLGGTPLHSAVKKKVSDEMPSIIVFLAEKGCPLNTRDSLGCSPLRKALLIGSNYEICLALLIAGARVGRTDENSILWLLLTDFQPGGVGARSRQKRFKLCLKFAYLRKQSFRLKDLVRGCRDYDYFFSSGKKCMSELQVLNLDYFMTGHIREFSKFCSFGKKCLRELKRMKSRNVGHGRTLRDFAYSGFILPQKDAEVNHSELNQLLRILGRDSFPIYHEVMAARVSKQALIETLKEVSVYSARYPPGSSTAQKVILNYACVCDIVKDLDINNLLSFVAAFFVLNNCVDGGHTSGDDKLGPKRSAEESAKVCKRPKMD